MRWLRLANKLGMWLLIVIPILWSGISNLREQFGYGAGRPWDSWSAVLTGWGGWLIGIVIWIVIVRGVTGWIDRKLGPN